jgi:predicted ABC-type ATPase
MRRSASNCHIIAGPNGAGKTTFATKFLPTYADCRNFVNPDLLARAYSPFDPDAGMFRAGRAVLENSSDTPRLIFSDQSGQTTVNDRAAYEALRQQFAP